MFTSPFTELLSCHFLLMRAKALFTLVYLINEDENEALNQGDDNIKFVLKVNNVP